MKLDMSFNPIHTHYAEHVARAHAEGFKQMPFGRFIKLHAELYWGVV
jgi:hypothetical protein